MKRLWIVLTLLLAACATPTGPPPHPDTPTPTQFSTTPALPAPAQTSTIQPTETPSGLAALLFDAQQAWHETHIDAAGLPPIDLRPGLIESGDCPLDCAGFFYPTESGALEMTITLIAFEHESGASEKVRLLAQEYIAGDAREVKLSENAVFVDFLPDGYRVFYYDQSWFVFAPYGNIFVGVILKWTLEYDQPLPEDDIISFSHVTAEVASAQIERLVEAGY
jgi:hypothetical protein